MPFSSINELGMIKKLIYKSSETDKRHLSKLRDEVNNVISNISSNRIKYAQFRAVFFPILYMFLYFVSTQFYENMFSYYLVFALMGITVVLIFVNLVHDAVHQSIFRNKKMNNFWLYFFDIIGGNSYIWNKRHKLLHHRYQNIAGWDSDIEQASIFRIYPHDKKNIIHTFQPILIFFFYPIFLLNWLFIRDFKDFFSKKQLIRKVCDIPKREYAKLFLFKLFYIFYIVIVPVLNGVSVLQAIGAMVFMIVVAGIFALLVLLTPHANLTNKFPLPDDHGKLSTTWLIHQFETANDIILNNWASRNIMGNFNYHVAHHIFPKINSSYAPEVTEKVKEYAEMHGFNYRTLTLEEAFKEHYKLIKLNAK